MSFCSNFCELAKWLRCELPYFSSHESDSVVSSYNMFVSCRSDCCDLWNLLYSGYRFGSVVCSVLGSNMRCGINPVTRCRIASNKICTAICVQVEQKLRKLVLWAIARERSVLLTRHFIWTAPRCLTWTVRLFVGLWSHGTARSGAKLENFALLPS